MANKKIDKGTILVTQVKKGFAMSFQPDGGNAFTLSHKPENAALNNVRGTLTREDGKAVKLVTEAGVVVFEPSVSSAPSQAAPAPDSFKPAFSLLPVKTQNALKHFSDPDNFYLKLYKAARFDEKEGKFLFFKTNEKERGKLAFSIRPNFGNHDLDAIHRRQLKYVRALGFSDKEGRRQKVDASADGRWVTGLGNASVYENGMMLHHVYGFPYLPGSGVKGMVRTWMINECFGIDEEAENSALQHPIFKAIFGHGKLGDVEGHRGGVYFFDAYPLLMPTVTPDVMNNHFQDYYEGKTPPADWLQPNPIFFLSCKGGRFRFQLGLKAAKTKLAAYGDFAKLVSERFNNEITAESSLLDLTAAWLKDALHEHGIGAKTAVGYGVFQ